MTELLQGVLRTQLQRLEENQMVKLPLYDDLKDMQKRSSELVNSEMAEAVLGRFGDCGAVVMTAAVADYRPKCAAAGKLKKSGGDLLLELDDREHLVEEPRIDTGEAGDLFDR